MTKKKAQGGKGDNPVRNYLNLTDEQRLERLTDLIAKVVVDEVFRKMEQRKSQEKPVEIEH